MKKLLLISILLGSIILTGCSQKWLSQDELFEKKQECANMKNVIQQEQIQWISVTEIFYNEQMNTCLYVLQGNWAKFIIDRFWDEFNWLYNANSDYFCESTYWDITSDDWKEALKECIGKSKEFDKKLQELKWE